MKRANWILLIKAAVGILLFAALYRAAGARGMFAALANAHAAEFWIACCLMGVALAFNGLRWRVVMWTIEHPISLRAALTATFESVLFQQVVPGGIGGDVSRGVRAYDAGVSPQWAFIGVVIDRGAGVLFIAVTLVVAAVAANSQLTAAPVFKALMLTSYAIVAGAGCAAAVGAFPAPHWLSARAAPLAELLRANSKCMRSARFLVFASIYLICSNLASIASFLCCARALDVHVGLWDAAIIVQGMVLVSILPISVGGWGLRESAALVLFAPLGVEAPRAMAVSVLFGLVLTALGVFGALIWFTGVYRRLSLSSVSEADPELQRGSRRRVRAAPVIVDTEAI